MNSGDVPRRDFLKLLAGCYCATAFDWSAFPVASRRSSADAYDVIIIGSGLGGLSCGAAFARQGFKPLVIEKHDKPGGYATAFARPGGFTFDVSLHSTTVGERNGVRNLISGFPEITDVEFLSHPTLFRSIFPSHDIRVRQRDPNAFVSTLVGLFPQDADGIRGLFDDMDGLGRDIARYSSAQGKVDFSRFARDYPFLARVNGKTWGAMVDARTSNPMLKGILSAQWAYYGLPPSRLAAFYYALPFMGYLREGGYYPKGRSQAISSALARLIQQRGGTVLLNTKVEQIVVKENQASGVVTSDGRRFASRVVVSNADPFATFTMAGDQAVAAEYRAKWTQFSISPSSFQVFLGLKEDLVRKSGVTDSEIFIEPSYDPEAGYASLQKGDVENGGICVTLYDNIDPAYSPPGKNTVNVMTLQGYGPWERFERDYLAGNKTAYRREKERMADILIRKAEQALLPGLSRATEVKEIGTPLTNVRYTGHRRGAIYGWDQTVNNSGAARVGHATPIKNLYLAGAWSSPGHGYGAVIPSGLQCFAEIVKGW